MLLDDALVDVVTAPAVVGKGESESEEGGGAWPDRVGPCMVNGGGTRITKCGTCVAVV